MAGLYPLSARLPHPRARRTVSARTIGPHHQATQAGRPAQPSASSIFFEAGARAPGLSSPFQRLIQENTMSDLQARFDQAQIDVKQLAERPSNMTLLRLYALFKQGSEGDAHGDKPGMTDFVGRYKFEAWETLKGTGRDEAKEKYIALVEELRSGSAS